MKAAKRHFLKYYKIYGILFLFLISVLFSFLKNPTIVENEEDLEPTKVEKEEKKEELVLVDVKGAVITPGVYKVKADARIEEALKESGGLRADADTNYINLSKKVKDEMVIIIYTKEEINGMVEGNTTIKYIDKECVCPVKQNDGCIGQNKVTNQKEKKTESSGPVNINNASLEELQTLSGIGEAKAKLIISYREKTPFLKIEDIQNIKGIGASIFAKIKDNITV
ncbi:MAG: helix-hairpin-helix domain-containing protein [Bacilli bacterium]|nr:helix-hairpin-helix domain-containing protein [Bacilli bacterium]